MARVPSVGTPDELLMEPESTDCIIVARKSGMTPYHARLLAALERIAAYYDSLPPVKGQRKGDTDA